MSASSFYKSGPPIENVAVCRRIDSLRHSLGYTQNQFASALQISQPAVSKYLRDRIPPADILYRISQLMKTSMEWILTGQTRPIGDRVSDSAQKYETSMPIAVIFESLSPEIRRAVYDLIRALTNQGL